VDGRQDGRLGGDAPRGKAVEVNALWHNALCVLAHWLGEERDAEAAAPYAEAAARARDSFNARFWHEAGGYLYDVVDGPDGDSAEFRPNQLLAVSLPHPRSTRRAGPPSWARASSGW
jgi:predicted glycogen debranching enzyme